MSVTANAIKKELEMMTTGLIPPKEAASSEVVVEEPKEKRSMWDMIAHNKDCMSDDGSSHRASVFEEMMFYFYSERPLKRDDL